MMNLSVPQQEGLEFRWVGKARVRTMKLAGWAVVDGDDAPADPHDLTLMSREVEEEKPAEEAATAEKETGDDETSKETATAEEDAPTEDEASTIATP